MSETDGNHTLSNQIKILKEAREKGDFSSEDLTAKQFAAIALRVPNSGYPWLDAMIRQNLKQEAAMKAIQGFCSYKNDHGVDAAMAIGRQMLAEMEE